jgi:hypothetical protein
MHFALRSLNRQRCATSPKSKKIKNRRTQQKVFFCIGVFQYTSVSVGKGGSSPIFFLFGPFFFVFFFEKKRRTVISAPFWAFEKKAGFRWWEFKNTGNLFSAGQRWFS